MIDTHCHLLPNIDDGSSSFEASLQLLQQMVEDGITHTFLTSHYLPGLYQYDRALYDERFEELQTIVQKEDIHMTLYPGFEVFLNPTTITDIERFNLTLGNSHYVLIECDLNGLPKDFYENVYPLLRNGYRPILAHTERYVSIMHKPHNAKELMEKDIYLQINAGSLLGKYGEKVRQTAWVLLDNGWAHLLGSDSHANEPNNLFPQAIKLIKERIDEHTVQLLTQDFPQMIINDEQIPLFYVYINSSHHHHHHHKSFWERIFG